MSKSVWLMVPTPTRAGRLLETYRLARRGCSVTRRTYSGKVGLYEEGGKTYSRLDRVEEEVMVPTATLIQAAVFAGYWCERVNQGGAGTGRNLKGDGPMPGRESVQLYASEPNRLHLYHCHKARWHLLDCRRAKDYEAVWVRHLMWNMGAVMADLREEMGLSPLTPYGIVYDYMEDNGRGKDVQMLRDWHLEANSVAFPD